MNNTTPDDFDLDDDLDIGTGIRRVNNMPLYIVITVSVVFVLTMMGVIVHRSQNRLEQNKEQQERPTESSEQASQIVGKNRTGFVQAATPAMTMPEHLPTPATDKSGIPPLPAVSSETEGKDEKQAALEAELQELRTAKLELLKTAITAKSSVPLDISQNYNQPKSLANPINALEANTADSSSSSKNPIERYKQTIDALKAAGIIPTQPGQNASSTNAGYQTFDNQEGNNRWKSASQVEHPETLYQLRAGFVIPGTLIGGINSASPGQIVAQVGQNVYDTATGRYLLIPQGSRLVGSYSSDIGYGQERLLVAWQRIIFPDGKAQDIGAMPGADSAGYSGFSDQTNNHTVRLFGSALLMSAVVAATSLSQLNGNTSGGNNTGYYGQQTTAGTLNQALGQQLGQVTAQMIAKNLNIAPTLEIRPGFQFNVVVTKDLTFTKPYTAFDYSLQE